MIFCKFTSVFEPHMVIFTNDNHYDISEKSTYYNIYDKSNDYKISMEYYNFYDEKIVYIDCKTLKNDPFKDDSSILATYGYEVNKIIIENYDCDCILNSDETRENCVKGSPTNLFIENENVILYNEYTYTKNISDIKINYLNVIKFIKFFIMIPIYLSYIELKVILFLLLVIFLIKKTFFSFIIDYDLVNRFYNENPLEISKSHFIFVFISLMIYMFLSYY